MDSRILERCRCLPSTSEGPVVVDAEHLGALDRGPQLACQELDEGGFPSPVRAEDTEELAFVDRHVQRVERDEVPVAFASDPWRRRGGPGHGPRNHSPLFNPEP